MKKLIIIFLFIPTLAYAQGVFIPDRLSDLSDVGTVVQSAGNILISDGTVFNTANINDYLTSSCFESDGVNIMPVDGDCTDTVFELDVNGDIMPQ